MRRDAIPFRPSIFQFGASTSGEFGAGGNWKNDRMICCRARYGSGKWRSPLVGRSADKLEPSRLRQLSFWQRLIYLARYNNNNYVIAYSTKESSWCTRITSKRYFPSHSKILPLDNERIAIRGSTTAVIAFHARNWITKSRERCRERKTLRQCSSRQA